MDNRLRRMKRLKRRTDGVDRMEIIAPKGGRRLVEAGAAREDISVTEFLRRAVLARLGLRTWPYAADVKRTDAYAAEVVEASTKRTPELADRLQGKTLIDLLREHEEKNDRYTQAALDEENGESDLAMYRATIKKAELESLSIMVNSMRAEAQKQIGTAKITLSGHDIYLLRKLLATLETTEEGQHD